MLDNGRFPTKVSELTIEYSGNEAVCETTKLNSDSSVYLAGCTVAGRSAGDYTYGTNEVITYDAYIVGDHVLYNGITYYVIEDSDATYDTVKLFKEEPLLKTEIDALNISGVIVEQQYTYGYVKYGDSSDYSMSIVKQIVDAWKTTALKSGDTANARLIKFAELNLGLGFTGMSCTNSCLYTATNLTPSWTHNQYYDYWTMDPYEESQSQVWYERNTAIDAANSSSRNNSVRPVLELNKSADITKIN